MASLRKRNNRWQAQVRSQTYGSVSKSFHLKADALKWAVQQEALMQAGQWSRTMDQDARLSDLVTKYRDEVTPQKRNHQREITRLNRLLRESIMQLPLSAFTPTQAAAFRDRRLTDGPRATEYDLVLLRHAWNIAKKEWGWPLSANPLEKIRFPKTNPPRERRLMPGEFERLQKAAVLDPDLTFGHSLNWQSKAPCEKENYWHCNGKILILKNGPPFSLIQKMAAHVECP